jgi:hypothetical protein
VDGSSSKETSCRRSCRGGNRPQPLEVASLLKLAATNVLFPGDLIQVQTSDWEVLEAGDWLRVCEPSVAAVEENLLRVAPRQRVSTMWGPLQGLPDGTQPEVMHTTGGPFRTLQITDLEELEYRGRGIDVFWCWRGAPQEGQRRDRPLRVGLWSCGRLRSEQQAAVRIVNGGV